MIKKVRNYVFVTQKDFEDYFTFKEHSIPVLLKNWRLGEVGDWVLADDGGVAQILAHGKLRHDVDKERYWARRGYVRTVVGVFIANDDKTMDTKFENHANPYNFSYTRVSSGDRIKQRERPTMQETKFAIGVATGKDPVEIYMKIYGSALRSTAERKALLLLNQERIMNIVKDVVSETAGRLGITVDYVLQMTKDLAEKANRDDVRLMAVNKLGQYIGVEKTAAEERMREIEANRNKQIGAGGSIRELSAGQLERPLTIQNAENWDSVPIEEGIVHDIKRKEEVAETGNVLNESNEPDI
jgi:hypothetical protein